jgi:hypothetical protein
MSGPFPIRLERISYPFPDTVHADTRDMVVSQMKKTSPSFTFEVKRSKFSSQKPSSFERFVLEPKRKLLSPVARLADKELSQENRNEAPAVERRILESLPKLPVEHHVVAPAEQPAEAPATAQAPAVRRKRNVAPVMASEEMAAPPAEHIVKGGRDAVETGMVIPLRLSRTTRKASAVEQLPRGDRWKRRLPKAAW